MATSKRQILDPIGVGCKLILLTFADKGTKIRITDHTVQLVPNYYTESLFYRPLVYGDKRDDICVLFSAIVRFIELYLLEKKTLSKVEQQNSLLANFEDSNDKQELTGKESPKEQFKEFAYSEKCRENMKKLAGHIIEGLSHLAETYEFDNAVFTIQCFSNLLSSAIEGHYTPNLLPKHLRDITSQNIIDVSKIKGLWGDDVIIELTELFEKCFDASRRQNITLVNSYNAAIQKILTDKDEEFKKSING